MQVGSPPDWKPYRPLTAVIVDGCVAPAPGRRGRAGVKPVVMTPAGRSGTSYSSAAAGAGLGSHSTCGRGMSRPVRVTGKDTITQLIVELTLEPLGGDRLPDSAPGAHIDLRLPGGVVRQYSLCGKISGRGRWHVTILHELEGRGGSAYVHSTLSVGDVLEVSGLRNNGAPGLRLVLLSRTPRHPTVAGCQAAGGSFCGSRWAQVFSL
jgi:hypothetical protein